MMILINITVLQDVWQQNTNILAKGEEQEQSYAEVMI